MTMLVGGIADDFTGATDLAGTLVHRGMRAVMTINVPIYRGPIDTDAVVVALKSRNFFQEALEENVARQGYGAFALYLFCRRVLPV